jgi:hypothetical protein
VARVIVDQKRARGKVWFKMHWQTGALTEHEYTRRVSSYDQHADIDRIEQRIRELHGEQEMDEEIASILNAEGLRTTKRGLFNNNAVWFLRRRMGLAALKPSGPLPERCEDGAYSVEGAAKAVGVLPGAIFKWLRTGRIQGEQLRKGMPWKILLTPERIGELQAYVQRVRRSRRQAS